MSEVVHVTWLDSMVSQGSWHDRADLLENMRERSMRHESVGWLVAENEHAIVIALSRNDDGSSYAGVMTIPRVAVVDRSDR